MGGMRTPFQGVGNIVRFNWPWFAGSAVGLLVALLFAAVSGGIVQCLVSLAACGVLAAIAIPLGVSYLVYDHSGLYELAWVDGLSAAKHRRPVIVNVSAGFDETTEILRQKVRGAVFHVWDFYDASTHTEASIRRARARYPADPDCIQVSVDRLPLDDGAADVVFLIMSAHEIRKPVEQRTFFEELHRISQPDGRVYVTEHLRDLPNFLAYSLGFFHFHSRSSWLSVFRAAGFDVIEERKHTVFVSTFVLKKRAH